MLQMLYCYIDINKASCSFFNVNKTYSMNSSGFIGVGMILVSQIPLDIISVTFLRLSDFLIHA